MDAITEALHLASRLQQAGDLNLARQVYCKILEADPNHAEALHFLGLLAHQVGQHDLAIQCMEKSLAMDGSKIGFYNNLGSVYKAAGKLAQAEQNYRCALLLKPDFAEGHSNLGVVLFQKGEVAAAIDSYRQALKLNPDCAEGYSNLGVALGNQGKLAEAVACFQQALRLKPDYADAHNNLGLAWRDEGKLEEAKSCFQKALQIRPTFAEAHANLGIIFRLLGCLEEAIASSHQALLLKPDYAEAHRNLGNAYWQQGKLDAAVGCYYRVLSLNPNYPAAHNDLGIALSSQGLLEEAVVHYQTALRLNPTFAEAYNNMGNALRYLARIAEAMETYQEALRITPDYPEVHNNMASLLMLQGRLPEAMNHYRQALRIKPDYAESHSNMLFYLNYDPEVDPDEVFAEHCRWGELHGRVPSSSARHDNDPSPERRLRIGYVSPDFRQHALIRFFEPVLANHDPAQVEIICYANVIAPDSTTLRLRSLAHAWRSIWGRNDRQVAEQVRSDRIDILVDLAGHTANNRLTVFAHRPAPVQVTYLGYPNTTGLPVMDYKVTDAVLDPPGDPVRHTEELVRLPWICCFLPPENTPEITPLPALKTGRLTFGSLHNLAKLNAKVIDLWCRVLQGAPSTRLLIFRDGLVGDMREQLARQFTDRGIAADRLDLREGTIAPGYLGIYEEIDVALDVFPYSGSTTTREALWMGVPMLTLAGKCTAQRGSEGVLATLGLNDFVAATPEGFVSLGAKLPDDLPRLARLRSELRPLMQATICDGRRHTRNLEQAYREMWRRWCAKQWEEEPVHT